MNYGTFVNRMPASTDPVLSRALADVFRDIVQQVLQKFPEGSATYDPPNLAAGAIATTTVTVNGANVGDFVLASHSDSTTANANLVDISAKVTATSTVTVTFRNNHVAAVDLASGTLRAIVIKKEA